MIATSAASVRPSVTASSTSTKPSGAGGGPRPRGSPARGGRRWRHRRPVCGRVVSCAADELPSRPRPDRRRGRRRGDPRRLVRSAARHRGHLAAVPLRPGLVRDPTARPAHRRRGPHLAGGGGQRRRRDAPRERGELDRGRVRPGRGFRRRGAAHGSGRLDRERPRWPPASSPRSGPAGRAAGGGGRHDGRGRHARRRSVAHDRSPASRPVGRTGATSACTCPSPRR